MNLIILYLRLAYHNLRFRYYRWKLLRNITRQLDVIQRLKKLA